mmetsp:Transcript_8367/g.25149  ORF Transcript_8367/g.25149 Transcript_8367/m.25149 type:complete len:218 (+) Transcript_8367:297-950(+)
MNIFRLSADLSHVAAILLLLMKIKKSRSSAGISLLSQQLYFLVFVCRYSDLLFTNPFHSKLTFYNTIMKILFISTSVYTIYLIRKKYHHTYSETHDTFRIIFLIAPAAVMALLVHMKNTVFEIVWAFSIYLEALAILPQLFLLQKTGEVENLTAHYIICLGAYRGLYLLNWIYRYATEGKTQWIVSIAGFVQTALYADFFYYYFQSKTKGQKLKLPP